MARKKDTKALFEVLAKNPRAISVPDWIKSRPAEPPPQEPETETPDDLPQEQPPAEMTTENEIAEPPDDDEALRELAEQADRTDEPAAPAAEPEPEAEAEIEEEPPGEPEPIDETEPEPEVELVEDEPAEAVETLDEQPVPEAPLLIQDAEDEPDGPAEEVEPELDEVEELPEEELDEDGRPAEATVTPADVEDVEETDEDEPADEPIDEEPEEAAEEEPPVADESETEDLLESDADGQAETEGPTETVEPPFGQDRYDLPAAGVGFAEASAPEPGFIPPPAEAQPSSPNGDWASSEPAMLRLRPVPAVVLLLGIAVLLVLSFLIGRASAPQAGPPEGPSQQDGSANGAEASTQPPMLGINPVRPPDRALAARSGQRDPKRYYLIVESLKGKSQSDYAEAERIVAFCQERSLPADIVLMGDRLAIWGLLGFRRDDSPEALAHARRVEKVGQEYFDTYKTYKFLQRKKEDGPFRPFFYSGRSEAR